MDPMGLLNHAKSLFFTAFLLNSAVFPLLSGAVSPVHRYAKERQQSKQRCQSRFPATLMGYPRGFHWCFNGDLVGNYLVNSSPWKDPSFLIGKPSISMGHGFHGYVK